MPTPPHPPTQHQQDRRALLLLHLPRRPGTRLRPVRATCPHSPSPRSSEPSPITTFGSPFPPSTAADSKPSPPTPAPIRRKPSAVRTSLTAARTVPRHTSAASSPLPLRVRVRVRPPWWRWRESNPRPPAVKQDFSGRSLLWLFSAPAITQASRRAGLSHCGCRRGPRDRDRGHWPSCRRQLPGRRRSRANGSQPRSGGEGEIRLGSVGSYSPATMVREITSPPRPASPGSTSDVETCHPPVELSAQLTRTSSSRRPPPVRTARRPRLFPGEGPQVRQ